MQLRRLRVRNIRSYEGGDVEFPPGTTLLAGDVGAGKTSLLYAVEMALFGVAEVDAAYLVRHGAPHAEVDVEFEDAEHRYRISRRFRRVQRKGRPAFEPEKIAFRTDGSEMTYSATELRQRVIELLGFPDNPNPQAHSDLWRWAVYVPQERMRDILAARPADRLETVRKALGVERYRIAADNSQELAADLRRSMNGRRAEAERLRHFDLEHAEATAETDRLGIEQRTLSNTIRERTEIVERSRVDLARAEAAASQAVADQREAGSLAREQMADARLLEDAGRSCEERLREVARREEEAALAESEAGEEEARKGQRARAEEALHAARAALDQQHDVLRTLAEARAELAHATRRLSEHEIAQGRAERERDDLAKELATVSAEGPAREPPAPTRRTLVELDEQLRRAREREATGLAELARQRAVLGEIDELLAEGICPRCHQTVRSAEFGAHREEAAIAAQSLDESLRQEVLARTALEEERRSRERYERAHERWQAAEQRRGLAAAAVRRAEDALRAAADAVGSARASVLAARARTEGLAPAEAEAHRLRSELGRCEEELRRRNTEVERAQAAGERRRIATGALEALRAEVGRLERDLAAIRSRSAQREERLASLRARGEALGALEVARAEADRNHRKAAEALAGEQVLAARVEARLEEAARRIRAAERGRAERAALLTEANDLEQKAAWVAGPFRSTLVTMERKLLAHARVLFERNFARYFSSLVDDPALVALTDLTFTPGVTIDGEWTPAEALSGGERTSLALAFRLALAQVVRSLGSLRLDTILLDEPTDGFSPEQIVRMGELLDELALPQVVIVSHEGELAAIADRVVRVEKRDGRSILLRTDGGPLGGSATGVPGSETPAEGTPEPPRRRRGRTQRSSSLD